MSVRAAWLPGSVLPGVRLLTLLLALALEACHPPPAPAVPPVAAQPPGYVGSASCTRCHAAQAAAWQGSHHQQAMQEAREGTVLGRFDGASFRYAGTTSRFFRRDGRYYVTTDGADGRLADFEIRYTFGVSPLQQYLIAFPDGRLQALSIAWDSRPAAKGGQRWFHLYPNEHVTHADPLHWTKPSQNWNSRCAACHSTNLRRRYDAAQDRFATDWSEISVGCEACHGPASGHLAWAAGAKGGGPVPTSATLGLLARFEAPAAWNADATTHAARRATPRTTTTELDTCGVCHARRAELAEGHEPGQPLAATHLPALLTRGLYQADGQMQDEVYNYGSFLQSKMHANGVSCSDCHDSHSLKLRLPGNAQCAQCHLATRYDTAEHSHHAAGTPGSACVDCHMPVRTYMGVHRRHDHSFRIPRPDRDGALGTADACTDCHARRTASWAAGVIEQWFGPTRAGYQTFGAALQAARTEQRDAPAALLAVANDVATPAIARATALAALSPYLLPSMLPTFQAALSAADPLLRIGALNGLETLPLERRWGWAGSLLQDPLLAVRLQAVPFLLAAPAPAQASQRALLEHALTEYVATERANADRAESRVNLGLVAQAQGDAAAAEAEYRAAIRLDASYTPARVNLADLYRALGRDANAQALLREGLVGAPADAALHHVLGLSLVRARRLGEALPELRRAMELAPASARYGYVYAIAQNSAGQHAQALATLRANEQHHPADRDTLFALVEFLHDAHDDAAAATYEQALRQLMPDRR